MFDSFATNETIVTNNVDLDVTLTILIPTYKDMPARLVKGLMDCTRSHEVALIIYDDGSNDTALFNAGSTFVSAWQGPARFISCSENYGRAHARNRLVAHAQSDWILFLDADMLPDDNQFINTYLKMIDSLPNPSLVAGGFSLKQITPNVSQSLHAAQSLKSECISAMERAKEPGLYVFTSNILVHKTVLEQVDFDDGFSGWGWEDVDWGLRVSKVFPIIHIENTATHLGLDDTDTLIHKFGSSGANFARLVKRHPIATGSMNLVKAAQKLARLPGRTLIRDFSKSLARSPLPISVRLKALKLYRAAAYAEVLN